MERRQVKLAQVREDKLGKYVEGHTHRYVEMDWREFVREARGAGDLRISEEARSSHPAGDMLMQFERNGVPVALSSAPLDDKLKKQRAARGPHKSCRDHLEFLREELLDYVEKGFWILLPYRVVKHLKELRLSPMGVVPQWGRRPRIIVDYSFYGLNNDTIQLTPKEAMQFGRALERILHLIRTANPHFGPVHLGKVDLSDGFYRLYLSDSSILKLAVTFPQYPGEEQLVASPLSIPMGWVESPPAFCVATETVADLANVEKSPCPQTHHWNAYLLRRLAITGCNGFLSLIFWSVWGKKEEVLTKPQFIHNSQFIIHNSQFSPQFTIHIVQFTHNSQFK